MKRKNLNGTNIHFPQDENIQFEEESHTYTVSGVGKMTPVSTVIGKFFKAFDSEYWSLRKCNGDKIAAARLREEWESKGSFASQAGTFLHKQIENYLNDKIIPNSLNCNLSYYGSYIKLEKQISVSREWSYFLAFDKVTEYTPFRTEWCIFDEEAKIAGTIDLVCSLNDDTYEIYDWKRSNKIDPSETNKWSNGINGLEYLTDTTYIHYCLQQNLYRYILEKNYGIRISKMNLVVLHPDLNSYKIVPIPRMDKEIQIITNYITSGYNS